MLLSLFGLIDNLITAAPAPERVAFLRGQAYAHRGLHGGGIIENSRAAFLAAIADGHGIELDVQATRDGESFVFHDAELSRLTNVTGTVADMSGTQVAAITLKGTNETIPRLSEILALVDGRVPILIEVKTARISVGMQCLTVRRALEGYRGNVGVMSFNPEVGRWFNDHAARIPRGLVVTEQEAKALPDRGRQAITRRLSLWRAKPDFLAYDVRDFPSRFAASQRKRGLPVLTWTVRTSKQEQTAAKYADEIIFERPDAAAP
jgi:glycerophosphoryl diester phosphodiesterase